MLLRAACICVLAIILTAGLWPFHAPRNRISWLEPENGLRFEKYSSVVTASEFRPPSPQAEDSCTIEIWPQPSRLYWSGTILSFYRPQTHNSPFAVRQSWGDLVLERTATESQEPRNIKVYGGDVLTPQKPVLLAIVSNSSGTAVYADGKLVKQLPEFRFSSHDLTGRLLLGNSPFSTHEWVGQLKGLAIYNRALTSDEVGEHYVDWTSSNKSALAADRPIALYLFDERGGREARNQADRNLADSSTNLVIPERFFILHEQFLARPWEEYRSDWRYWKDAVINIAGFVPLGLLFLAYFLMAGRAKHPAALTIALGFAVSLTIEVGQAFLPTRDSGMTDIITNTLGTAVGVLCFRLDAVQRLLTAAGIVPQDTTAANKADHPLHEMVSAGASESAR
jgi:hypothetical protein